MIIIGQRGLIYLISQNNQISFWHYCLIYINTAYIVRVFKFVDNIILKP